MGIVYAIVNQKGGVGKTTTAVNMAAYMALGGVKTLLVDLDAQGNATSGIGVDRNAAEFSTYDVLIEGKPVMDAILPTCVANLSLLPATIDLAGADMKLMERMSREFVLKKALEATGGAFEVVLIDGPPSLGLLTINALAAADAVIIPLQTEYYALEGISQLLATVDLVKRNLNPSLDVAKVILTMHDDRTRLGRQVVEDVRKFFREKVSSTVIPRNVRLSESPSHGLPIALYDPKSRGARAYYAITMEVLKNGKERAR